MQSPFIHYPLTEDESTVIKVALTNYIKALDITFIALDDVIKNQGLTPSIAEAYDKHLTMQEDAKGALHIINHYSA